MGLVRPDVQLSTRLDFQPPVLAPLRPPAKGSRKITRLRFVSPTEV